MPRTLHPWEKPSSVSFYELFKPALDAMNAMPELESRGNRPLKMSFEEHLGTGIGYIISVLLQHIIWAVAILLIGSFIYLERRSC